MYTSVCDFVCIALLLPFVLGFCLSILFFVLLLKNFFFFIIIFIFYFNYFIVLYFILFYFISFLSFILSFFFLPFILSHVEDRLLVLQPGVRAVPLRWESQLQNTGPQETSQLHVISNGENLQRSPSQHQDPAPLNTQQATLQDTLCQTTSKTGTQPHPLPHRLPKIIIRPQTPQNTPPDVDVPTRKTRSSLIHQNTGISPLHQESYTTH